MAGFCGWGRRRPRAPARSKVRPTPVLACRRMSQEDGRDAHEALAIEEADAWFEYLDSTRAELGSSRYEDVEPWAWARLNQRLRAVGAKRSHLRPAA